ncbi:MAG: hypothetical protein DRP47_00345 [Candidatus Zixiibacteriota bacterium]|nr:MAG: hypothetical protein DRP47_00345 [candidate division Zixibacteria bacterium]
MKKILVIIVLVIVLISLNWFKVLLAQDISSLSKEQIKLLYQKSRSAGEIGSGTDYYQTPHIFPQQSDIAEKKLPKNETPVTQDNAVQTITTNNNKNTANGIVPFEKLQPFGLNLFGNPSDIDPSIDIASANDYVLGPGDNIIIYLWGRVEREYNLTIDREGKVFLPKAGDLVAWGITLEQFTDRVRDRLSTVYSEFDLTVSLGKIRSMRIYVTGEVIRPGAYTVPSLTSVLNVLFTAGGPNQRGSLRNIKVMRSGNPVAEIDLYDFLLKGDNSNDIRLQTGDAVFVPVAGARAAIRGEVNRSAIFELTGGETVSQLLKLAGRPTPEAYLDRVMLERIDTNGEWQVLDLNLKSDENRNEVLHDGDRITVYSIFDVRQNMVSVFGKVKHPGYYERNDSTRVSDLLERGQLQRNDVYLPRADIFRRYSNHRIEVIPISLEAVLAGDQTTNIVLQDQDSLHIYSIDEIECDRYVFIEGEIKKPGRYPLYKEMTVEDLIFLAGSFNREADIHRAEMARIDSTGNVALMYLSLEDHRQITTELQRDDHLYIRRIPEWQPKSSIVVEGEVAFPGEYWLTSRNETLYDVIQRCGGFTPSAFPQGIILKRSSIGQNLGQLDITDKLQRTNNIVEDSLGHKLETQTFDYNLTSVNRIIIDIDLILSSKGQRGDIILEPGDKITVPFKPAGISIIGAIASNGTISYQKGSKVKSYIERAGGFTRQADKKETRLIRARGEVLSGGVLGKKVELGDVIVVPGRIQKDRNWLKTMTTMLTATTGILTSVYLISKL